MILRKSRLLPFKPSKTHQCLRALHNRIAPPPIPPPTPFIPDPQTFLTVIGRNLSQHAAKIPTWDALFSLTSSQLRELGVEPARSRRYLLQWRERFRNGEYGIGGDLQHVENGVAELRVVEQPVPEDKVAPYFQRATVTRSPGTKKIVVNVPSGSATPAVPLQEAKPVQGVKLRGAHTICGPHVLPLKGTDGYGARIAIKEGLWEIRRGHKVDGGERRKAETRAKRRAEERKTTRG